MTTQKRTGVELKIWRMQAEMRLIYEKEEMQKAINALNGLSVTGVENARRLTVVVAVLLGGRPEESEKKGEEKEEK